MAYSDLLRTQTWTGSDAANLIDGLIPNIQNQSYTYLGTTTGSANVQAGSASQAPSAYANGQMFLFNAGYTNTGSATLNVNSLGAITIYDNISRVALVGGEITANSIYAVVYRSGFFYLLNADPVWLTWSPTLTGFSANPTNTVYKYTKQGRLITATVRQGASGTSSTTAFTITAPVAAATVTNMVWFAAIPYANDNSADELNGRVSIASGASTFTLEKGVAGGLWTAAGGKRANFTITYEAAS